MASYLVVAHQTAGSPELLSRLKQVAEQDQQANFVLLFPATPVRHLLTRGEGGGGEIARQRALQASADLKQAGLRVTETLIGRPIRYARFKPSTGERIRPMPAR